MKIALVLPLLTLSLLVSCDSHKYAPDLTISKVAATSSYKGVDQPYKYFPSYVLSNSNDAWCENAYGSGKGESITIEFEKPIKFNSVIIHNGLGALYKKKKQRKWSYLKSASLAKVKLEAGFKDEDDFKYSATAKVKTSYKNPRKNIILKETFKADKFRLTILESTNVKVYDSKRNFVTCFTNLQFALKEKDVSKTYKHYFKFKNKRYSWKKYYQVAFKKTFNQLKSQINWYNVLSRSNEVNNWQRRLLGQELHAEELPGQLGFFIFNWKKLHQKFSNLPAYGSGIFRGENELGEAKLFGLKLRVSKNSLEGIDLISATQGAPEMELQVKFFRKPQDDFKDALAAMTPLQGKPYSIYAQVKSISSFAEATSYYQLAYYRNGIPKESSEKMSEVKADEISKPPIKPPIN